MRNAMRWKLLRGAVVFVLAAGAAGAQTPGAAGRVAPVPPGVFSAKKVFVSNAGADGGLFPHPFSGGPERGYNNFYAAVQARWGNMSWWLNRGKPNWFSNWSWWDRQGQPIQTR